MKIINAFTVTDYVRLALMLLATLLIVLSNQVRAQDVGRVMVAVGDVSADRGGTTITLNTGAGIRVGDTVKLGQQSNVQLRFADGGIVALRSNSVFRVDQYRYDAAGKNSADDSVAAFSLIKGGMRALTGLLTGNADRYRVRTKNATLGIRGTHYALLICESDCQNDGGANVADGVYGGVYEGKVVMQNAAGEGEFSIDEYFFVATNSTLPQRLNFRPGFLRDRLEGRARRDKGERGVDTAKADGTRDGQRADGGASRQQQTSNAAQDGKPNPPGSGVVAVELRDSAGNVAVLGPGLGLSVSFGGNNAARSLSDGGTTTGIVIDGNLNAPNLFRLLDGEVGGSRNGAGVADTGLIRGDGAMSWGRWLPGGLVSSRGQAVEPGTGLHYVFGTITPVDVFARPIASIGVAASQYDYIGGTNPTNDRGVIGQFTTGSFSVDFLARTISGNINYSVGAVSFSLLVPTATPLQVRPGVVGFNFTANNQGAWTCTLCGAANARGVLDNYSISGLFFGSRAQGLGVTYSTIDNNTGRTAGAAVFGCRGCRRS